MWLSFFIDILILLCYYIPNQNNYIMLGIKLGILNIWRADNEQRIYL